MRRAVAFSDPPDLESGSQNHFQAIPENKLIDMVGFKCYKAAKAATIYRVCRDLIYDIWRSDESG